NRQPDGICLGMCNGSQANGHLSSKTPLVQPRQRKRHRRRGIDDHARSECRAISREPYVRAIASREQPPIHATWIIALTIGTKLAELRGISLELRGMRAECGAEDATRRRPANAAAGVAERPA